MKYFALIIAIHLANGNDEYFSDSGHFIAQKWCYKAMMNLELRISHKRGRFYHLPKNISFMCVEDHVYEIEKAKR